MTLVKIICQNAFIGLGGTMQSYCRLDWGRVEEENTNERMIMLSLNNLHIKLLSLVPRYVFCHARTPMKPSSILDEGEIRSHKTP